MKVTTTRTSNDQTDELIKNGLDDSTCDVQLTVKTIKATGTEISNFKSWSLAKLLSFIPCDKDHKLSIVGIEGERCKITISSSTDKYRKSVEGNCYVDAAYEAVLYLLKKKLIKEQ